MAKLLVTRERLTRRFHSLQGYEISGFWENRAM